MGFVEYGIRVPVGRGMVVRNGSGENAETALIALTEAGADEMRAYLLAALRLSPWVQ
jgi:hypothetical protein